MKSTLDNKLHPAIDRKVAQLTKLNPRASKRGDGSHRSGNGGSAGAGGDAASGSDGDAGGGSDDEALEADLREQMRLNAELKARLQSIEQAGVACWCTHAHVRHSELVLSTLFLLFL